MAEKKLLSLKTERNEGLKLSQITLTMLRAFMLCEREESTATKTIKVYVVYQSHFDMMASV